MRRHFKHTPNHDIAPDEIFLDDRNIPEFDVQQFEGRIEAPIERRTIVFLGAFFPIFTNAYFGAVSLPVVYKNISESFEIRKSTFVSRILFYFALPSICTGLKIGIGMAWMSVIAAELIGAQSGLGYFIQLNRLLLRTDNVVLGMILIGLIGYVLTKSLEVLGEWATPWVSKNKS